MAATASTTADSPTAASVNSDPDKLKKRILVLPFLNKSRHGGPELGEHAGMLVTNALLKSNEFIIVPTAEVANIDALLTDLGEYDIPLILAKARSYGISGVVLGKIQDVSVRSSGEEIGLFRTRYYSVGATVRLQVYDATTERELSSKVVSAETSEEHTDIFNNREPSNFDPERGKIAVSKAIEKEIPTLPYYVAKVAWTGRIAKVDIHRYYINAGEMSGVSVGQLLKVYDIGQPIHDPDTRNLLGIAPGRFKGLLKVVDHFGKDGSVAVVHSGGGFRERDRVEVFTPLQK